MPTRSFQNEHRNGGRLGRLGLGGGLGVFLLAAFLASGCSQDQPKQAGEKKLVDVEATTPITDEVMDYQDFTGRLDAVKTVDIRARVSGFITSAPFKEGDLVHEGD